MKQYEKYKDSGIQWLGEVPNHWEINPFKRGMLINNGKDYKHIETLEGYPVIGSGGQFAYASEYLYDGEAVLLGRKGTIDKPKYINGKFWTVDTMFYAIPQKQISTRYMYYQALIFPFGLYQTDTAVPSMTQTDLGNNPVCYPPLSEQLTIAAYLDYKVGQIDAAIKEKEAILEDLKMYRNAIISEAVTKGLDKNVPMKDSGKDGIGNIPNHWKINKLKYFADIQTGSTPSTSIDTYWNNPTEDWFTPSDFNDDEIHLGGSTRRIAKAAFDEFACRVFVPKSVLIVGIGATLGKVGISNQICSANQQINAITFKENVEPIYGAYYLYSMRELMKSVANAATLAIMNQATTGDLPFVCPPINEQRRISETIEAKVSVIKSSMLEIEAQIADLQSYKSSIISEAVTGKVDLRNWNKKTVTA